MAERHPDGDPMERAETVDPRNPPRSVVDPDLKDVPKSAAGVAGMWYVLGPLVLLIVVLGIGIFFWVDEGSVDPEESPAVGTIGGGANERTPGGGDPDSRPGSTGGEVEFRSGGELPQGPMPGLTNTAPVTTLSAVARGNAQEMAGRRVDVHDVVIASTRDAAMFRIQDGDASATVIAPPDSPGVRAGMRVDVSGTLEPDGQGGVRIRATRVNTR